MIQISEEGLARANALLRHIPGAFPKAVARAANRALDGMRTDAAKETRQRYFVTAADVRKTITLRKAGPGNMQAAMISRGKRRGLEEYRVTPHAGKRGGAKAAVKREGGLKPIPKAFFLPGKKPPFIRVGKARREIRALRGPAVPQILKNEETVEALEMGAAERFAKRLNHEVMRELGVTR